MRFDDDEQYGEEMVLSKEEIKLIKSKAKELKKICYGFGFFSFEVLSWHIGHEKKKMNWSSSPMSKLLTA